MIKRQTLPIFTAAALALCVTSQAAEAKLITSLSGGQALSFAGDAQSKRLDDGRFTRDYNGFVFAASPAPVSTNHFVRTSWLARDFGARGPWAGPMMMVSGGGARAKFEFIFDVKQAAVLFELNWTPGLTFLRDYEISIFDTDDKLLETATVAYGSEAGFFGFGERNAADIAKLTITGSEFGVRNMSVTDVVAGVPEPSSWAAMVVGFAFVGAAARTPRRRPLSAS